MIAGTGRQLHLHWTHDLGTYILKLSMEASTWLCTNACQWWRDDGIDDGSLKVIKIFPRQFTPWRYEANRKGKGLRTAISRAYQSVTIAMDDMGKKTTGASSNTTTPANGQKKSNIQNETTTAPSNGSPSRSDDALLRPENDVIWFQ